MSSEFSINFDLRNDVKLNSKLNSSIDKAEIATTHTQRTSEDYCLIFLLQIMSTVIYKCRLCFTFIDTSNQSPTMKISMLTLFFATVSSSRHGRSERTLDQIAFDRLMNGLKKHENALKTASTAVVRTTRANENEAKEQEVASYYLVLLQPYF